MPTIFRYGKYRFFFNSREESRRHIHIDSPDGTAKFWLEPEVKLAISYNWSQTEILEIEKIIKEKKDEFITAWNRHFDL